MFWPCETRTSICRNLATISSGLYRFLAITVLLDVKDIPQVGPLQWGRISYAVAVRDGSDLWLTLWVKRSKKGEFFIMVPRQDPGWDVHTSYHLDGTMHMKSFGHKRVSKKLQPLTNAFKGTEHLGSQMGHG